MAHPRPNPVREITHDDLLTWEVQLKREGTLPPEIIIRLMEHVGDRLVAVDPSQLRKYESARG